MRRRPRRHFRTFTPLAIAFFGLGAVSTALAVIVFITQA